MDRKRHVCIPLAYLKGQGGRITTITSSNNNNNEKQDKSTMIITNKEVHEGRVVSP